MWRTDGHCERLLRLPVSFRAHCGAPSDLRLSFGDHLHWLQWKTCQSIIHRSLSLSLFFSHQAMSVELVCCVALCVWVSSRSWVVVLAFLWKAGCSLSAIVLQTRRRGSDPLRDISHHLQDEGGTPTASHRVQSEKEVVGDARRCRCRGGEADQNC